MKKTSIKSEDIINQIIRNGGSIIENRKNKITFRGLFLKLKWFFLIDYPIHWNCLRDVYYLILYNCRAKNLYIVINFFHIIIINLAYFFLLISFSIFWFSGSANYFFTFFILTFLFFILKTIWEIWYVKKGIMNIVNL
ncbi:hypothetical protein [Leptospira interrogans]|uniref:Uncharacterized protein n=1 Tax=Leptospira interrogans serovar Lora str. TE 1992 TaxID=1193028 RepID=M3DHF3_LEPIR|nr:hypothetical protein [Leptospira interrogans]EMF40668.1 hypothetical protein LEP1GSC067_3166 [Leptospira interrogans serovar Lora str. TE 1992]EMN07595.1 hypothetical protein LEP1GSC053_4123 [Leptospira interrogans serovar Muenchen str. Brem 129]